MVIGSKSWEKNTILIETLNMEKFNYIDRLKGFAILLVIMGHMYLFPMHPNDDFIFRIICSFHMPLFLFLSGFVIPQI